VDVIANSFPSAKTPPSLEYQDGVCRLLRDRRPRSASKLEAGVLEVCGGDWQRVEHQIGGFALDLAGGEQAHDLREGDLNGVGILKDGQLVGGVATVTGAVGVEFQGLFALALVVVAEAVVADGGRAAIASIEHDVQAFIWYTGQDVSFLYFKPCISNLGHPYLTRSFGI
jgi:hypothetical protein